MKLIVIDAGIWVRLARSNYAQPIVDRIDYYNLLPVVNNYLLAEVHNALLKNKWATIHQADAFNAKIKNNSLFITKNAVYRLSPDPKDNYLFDLAVQSNCTFIISDDTELLSFALQPVEVKSCNWFLKQFPI